MFCVIDPCASKAHWVYRTILLLLPLHSTLIHAHHDFASTATTTTSLVFTSTITVTLSLNSISTTSTSGMAATVTVTQTAASSSPSSAASWTRHAFQDAVLNSTNFYRSHHQAKALAWNDTLADYAQNYAEKCIWAHSGGPSGENLAAGYQTPTAAIDAWAGEGVHYNFHNGGFGETTGHFTQLVWTNTTTVGCGAVNCTSSASNAAHGWYLVCEYFPPGNVQGQFQYNVFDGSGDNEGNLSVGKPSSGAILRSKTMTTLAVAGLLVAIMLA